MNRIGLEKKLSVLMRVMRVMQIISFADLGDVPVKELVACPKVLRPKERMST